MNNHRFFSTINNRIQIFFTSNIIFYSFLLFLISCSSEVSQEIIPDRPFYITDTVFVFKEKPTLKKIKLGIDVLTENKFDVLANKRVGLITNQTGVNSNLKSTIDILFEAQGVNLVALFGPEHGVRGDVEGGKYVEFYTDKKTKLPVYSLYGKSQKPTKSMLENIDILVYDIQDVGVRSYTFISTMGLAIEAASENGKEFMLLDRPNPLGGEKIEGNIVEPKFISFIGQFPIPYVYGLTCGELAKLLIGEKMVRTSNEFKFHIIPMENWKREMKWEDTSLEWIPTSPHIPHSFSPYFYPMTGILGELRSAISIGVGYTLPFQVIGAEWINSGILADYLNNQNVPGLFFRPITYEPYYAFGKGKSLNGVQIHIADYEKVNLTNTQFHILSAIQKLYPDKNLFSMANENEVKMFNNGIGTDKIYTYYNSNNSLKKTLDFLNMEIPKFRIISKKYQLYK